jgi:MIP family channel proteins
MDIVRRMIAEFIGTFALVFVGVGSIKFFAQVGQPNAQVNVLAIALAFGLTVAVMVAATGHISGGQFNPAVSIALLVTGKMSIHDALFYILTQLVAATVASWVLVKWLGVYAVVAGVTSPANTPTQISPMTAMWMEVVLTFFLVFVIFGVAVDKRGPNVNAGLMIGLTVALDILVGGPYTGASMNPARTFGPALVTSTWTAHWVYWVGPILGGALAGIVYNALFLPKVRPVAAAAVTVTTVTATARD